MSHTPPIFLTQGNKSSAFLTLGTPSNLVIFVHGFNGKSTATWNKFPELIRTNQDFDTSDVIFYGYESLKGQANHNALKFYSFLKSVCENSPNKLGFSRASIDSAFRYKKVIIVAHSLGAIIVRRGLLFAKRDNKNWLDNTKMVLFAPAHRGAIIQNLITECLPVVGKILAGLGSLIIPVINDLKPESQAIKNLITDTQAYLNLNMGDFTIATQVIWADKDIVVHSNPFCNDPVATLITNKSHSSVCKPNAKYLEPYHFVVNAL